MLLARLWPEAMTFKPSTRLILGVVRRRCWNIELEFRAARDILPSIVGEGDFRVDWVVLVAYFKARYIDCNIKGFCWDRTGCYLVAIRCCRLEFLVDGFGHGVTHVVFAITGLTSIFSRIDRLVRLPLASKM